MKRIVSLLLAAGGSQRFGDQDKLCADLAGKPLITHAAKALRYLPFTQKLAIISNPNLQTFLPGFETHTITPNNVQSISLRKGLQYALQYQPDAVLITLGDMPFVTALHLKTIIKRCTPLHAAASSDGNSIMPPACLPARQLASLFNLTGDQGAHAMLNKLPSRQIVKAPENELLDIDTMADLQRAQTIGISK